MKKFLLSLLDSSNVNSSKRFAALFTLFNTIVLAYIAASKNNWICPEFMYDGLLLVVSACFGANMVENLGKNKQLNNTTTQTTIETTPTTQSVSQSVVQTPIQSATQSTPPVDTPDEG